MNYKFIFIDSIIEGYPKDTLDKSEYDFFLSKNIIKEQGQFFKTNFVGEIITPHNKYFSVPKKFEPSESNIELLKSVLNKYAIINGKSIIENNTFTISPKGKLESEKLYYNELKNFFLDYITYEFIYPKKRINKFSTYPISGGKIDISSTDRLIDKRGIGASYKAKDFRNDENWKLDDIYWSTISFLADKYNDRREIDEMYNFLLSEGFEINKIDISDHNYIIHEIEKCEVGIIHNPIKETLISFYKSKNIDNSYKIKIFYTDNFAFVWEEMVRMALKENEIFRREYVSPGRSFYTKRVMGNWFKTQELAYEFIREKNKNKNMIKKIGLEPRGVGYYLSYEEDSISIPDLFSEYNNRRIIGDAKYYNDPEGSHYEKEFSTYNILSDNKYPMVILTPGLKTKPISDRREKLDNFDREFELIIFQLSIKDVIKDAVDNTNFTIDKIHTFLWDKSWTKR